MGFSRFTLMVYAHFLSESHQTFTKDKIYELHSGGILQKAPEPVNSRCNGTNDYQVTEAHKTHYHYCGILGENT